MRLIKNGDEYIGTPDEIFELLTKFDTYLNKEEPIEHTKVDFPASDFVDIVDESEDLRTKLKEDPNYNPFGGVVPPKESSVDSQTDNRLYAAENDTGVNRID